ncbi:hypothetical protein [Cellulophaga sp. L1A9]|uniref:hypothetical protein n=1 Tax=Cellulophaga sp. L1A9 TaxID=2686362 RepID=UPI00131C45FB|nr:hypothetical protein [Cellulophaga sp. L1A9]
MKQTFFIYTFLVWTSLIFCQKNEIDGLKKYRAYTEKNLESNHWVSKFTLTDGLISSRESYFKGEKRSRNEFEYDKYGNKIMEIRTFDINEGFIRDTVRIDLTYVKDSLLTERKQLGMLEKYSDFNAQGKPKILERTDVIFDFHTEKELYEYDKHGNISKITTYSETKKDDKTIEKQTEILSYLYDNRGNEIEIRRVYSPEREFPIYMLGGPSLHPIENYRYVYNKNGVWTKKFKIIDGKEKLIRKRKLEK